MCKRAGLPHLVGMCAARLSRKLDEAVRALPRRTLWAICAILRAFPGHRRRCGGAGRYAVQPRRCRELTGGGEQMETPIQSQIH
eukprot:254727-Chlamydomonas_euryale.AAC.4